MTHEQFDEALKTVKIDRKKELRRLRKAAPVLLLIHETMLAKLFDQIELYGNSAEYVSVRSASDILLDGLITLNYLLTVKGPPGVSDKKHSA